MKVRITHNGDTEGEIVETATGNLHFRILQLSSPLADRGVGAILHDVRLQPLDGRSEPTRLPHCRIRAIVERGGSRIVVLEEVEGTPIPPPPEPDEAPEGGLPPAETP